MSDISSHSFISNFNDLFTDLKALAGAQTPAIEIERIAAHQVTVLSRQPHSFEPRPYKKGIIHVHGPSAAGKTTLSNKLQKDLGGPKKAVILNRDLFIQASLDDYNKRQKKHSKISLMQAYKNQKQVYSQIFVPADKAMYRNLQSHLAQGKVVIWDTIKELNQKELEKNQLLNDAYIVRMITLCLDSPKDRDFNALSQRNAGMNATKQEELATIVFPELLYNIRSNDPKAVPHVNALYGWSRSGLEIKALYPAVLTAMSHL